MSRIRLRGIALGLIAAATYLTTPSAAIQAQDTDHPLADQLAALHRAGQYEEAVVLIQPVLEGFPSDHYLLCKLADNLTDWARVTEDEDEQEARYGEAVEVAQKAVESDTLSAEGWFQFGKAYGRLALFKGGKTKVRMSREVKTYFERSIDIDPRHAGALHGLARWHREVANLSWFLKTAAKIIYGGLPPASNEEAVALFERAIAIEPDMISHHLELGKTWLEMKEKDNARAEFDQVLALPETDADDAEWKVEAEGLMKKVR